MVFTGDPFSTTPDGSNGWAGQRFSNTKFTDAAGRIGYGGFGFLGMENGSFGAFGLLFKGALNEAAGLGFDMGGSGGEEDMIAMQAWMDAMEATGNPGQEVIIGEMQEAFVSAAEAALQIAADATLGVSEDDLGVVSDDPDFGGGTWFAYDADPYEVLVEGCSHPEAVDIILDSAAAQMVEMAQEVADQKQMEEVAEGIAGALGGEGGLGEAIGALIGFFF
jgi:hypothetical protein